MVTQLYSTTLTITPRRKAPRSGILRQVVQQGAQLAQAREALSWAARTYLVAALSAIASVLYYVFLILGRRD